MAKKSRRATRRSGSKRIVARVYAPVGFVLNSAGHIVKGVASTAGKMVRQGFHGVRKIGNSVANSANNMINRVTRRRRRN